jgi:hypothetical protein
MAETVMAATQMFALKSGFFVQRMMPQLHRYHLDDAPDLRSCNKMLRFFADGVRKSGPLRGSLKEARERA